MENQINAWQKTNLTLAAVALALTLSLIALSYANRGLQRQLQTQQILINNGQLTQQLSTTIIRELAQTGVTTKDQELIDLL